MHLSECSPQFKDISNLSSLLINTRKIDFRDKLNSRWEVRVCVTTVDVDTINAVLMGALRNALSALLLPLVRGDSEERT